MAKILLVDDDDSFRESLRKNLTEGGHEVQYAPNGKIANTMLVTENFDLVISDIKMPEMDGIELTKTIRSRSNVPIILITGFADLLETQEAHRLGANEFLAKPLKREDINGAIERCLKPKEAAMPKPAAALEGRFSKLGITDFLSGRSIKFGIFLRLSDSKFVKVAHKGEDLPSDRVNHYQSKGVHYLYVKQDDFRKYVGFEPKTGLSSPTAAPKKAAVLESVSAIFRDDIPHNGVNTNIYESAVAFVEASLDLVTNEASLADLLHTLAEKSKSTLIHGMGTGLYSLMIAQLVDWNLPTNKFKLVIGALFRDVGMKELKCDFLAIPRESWTPEQVKIFDANVDRGTQILNALQVLPDDIRDLVKEHIELTLTQLGSAQSKRSTVRPMVKLIMVAEEFCNRVIDSKIDPIDSIHDMIDVCADRLDQAFFGALVKLFPATGE